MRESQRWILFAICLAVVIFGLTYLSIAALRSHDAELETNRKAGVEENMRLALYRMELAVMPIVTQESARPHAYYEPFFTPQHAYDQLYTAIVEDDRVQLPSPLLAFESPDLIVHFRLQADGSLTSPQVPTGNKRDLAESRGFTTTARIEAYKAKLLELGKALDYGQLLTLLPTPKTPARTASYAPPSTDTENEPRSPRNSAPAQQLMNDREWMSRQNVVVQSCEVNMNGLVESLQPIPAERQLGDPRAVWLGDHLILARRVRFAGAETIQGCELNWPQLEKNLLTVASDLLPNADLVPVRNGADNVVEHRCLAFLPLELQPGRIVLDLADTGSGALRMSLRVAWISALVAATAIALLLVGAFLLHERRRRFVSAVTHELRTPLTTFRMYTEMLASGMVTGEKRDAYLTRLHQEAERLGHLVDNVLAYSRLEERGRGRTVEEITVSALVDRIGDRLKERAQQDDLELTVFFAEENQDGTSAKTLRTDIAAVERILFNLVDNACKYGRPARKARVELQVAANRRRLELTVRDFGPGIPLEKRKNLFRAFDKVAGETTSDSPGVGLGLALCRGLAAELGGELRLKESGGEGTVFLLTLPLG